MGHPESIGFACRGCSPLLMRGVRSTGPVAVGHQVSPNRWCAACSVVLPAFSGLRWFCPGDVLCGPACDAGGGAVQCRHVWQHLCCGSEPRSVPLGKGWGDAEECRPTPEGGGCGADMPLASGRETGS